MNFATQQKSLSFFHKNSILIQSIFNIYENDQLHAMYANAIEAFILELNQNGVIELQTTIEMKRI